MICSTRMHELRRAAAASVLALVMAAGTGAAALAQQASDEEDPYADHILNTDKKILNSILAPLGLAPSARETITYRERSPLVIPPSRELPPPESNDLKKNPAWPVNPEVVERKKEAAAAARMADIDPAKPLTGTKNDLRFRNIPKDVSDGLGQPQQKKEPNFFQDLFAGRLPMKLSKTDEVGRFTGEPPRTSLTEPPPGYLTPSAAARYGTMDRPQDVEKSSLLNKATKTQE